METPPTDTSPTDVATAHSETDDAASTSASRMKRVRIAAWGALSFALLGFIAFGSVPAISYTYYAFSGRVVRLSPSRSIIDIWRDAIAEELPAFSVGWLPGAVIVASVVVAVLCAIGGAWLLLVQAPDARRRAIRTQ